MKIHGFEIWFLPLHDLKWPMLFECGCLFPWGNATDIGDEISWDVSVSFGFSPHRIFNFNLPFLYVSSSHSAWRQHEEEVDFLLTWGISIWWSAGLSLIFQPTDLELAACWFPTFTFVCVRRFPHILPKHLQYDVIPFFSRIPDKWRLHIPILEKEKYPNQISVSLSCLINEILLRHFFLSTKTTNNDLPLFSWNPTVDGRNPAPPGMYKSL